MGRLYVVGQFDVRRFDLHGCRIELMEFRSVERDLVFVGSFDIDISRSLDISSGRREAGTTVSTIVIGQAPGSRG